MKINTITPDTSPFLKSLCSVAELTKIVYTIGALPTERRPVVAIIGTRKPTIYGTRVACNFAEALSRHNIIVISGLAYGIDAAAHRGAVQGGGVSGAVLAHGLDIIYPSAHTNLADKILASGGFLLSPYPPGTTVHKYRFLERNQWLAGLADLVLVVEAEQRSGTHATVRYALDYGKEVAAIPGPIDSPTSVGPNQLISQGAHPVSHPNDILYILGINPRRQSIAIVDNPVINSLKQHGPQSADDLSSSCHLSISQLLSQLTKLELDKLIQRDSSGLWHAIDEI
ncbi:DNA protecting protein DprA [Candidatus Saccharibacteria bacterium 32-49-12]|nr:MAG: DNA protecting protein DprA [Candidatus Saccharibacteria bacterium 32-49-12]